MGRVVLKSLFIGAFGCFGMAIYWVAAGLQFGSGQFSFGLCLAAGAGAGLGDWIVRQVSGREER